ncbi:hypothetical protein FJY90_02730 [Candidatus Gottesmanbacteria bacterium]|nr:hypothetical protein [Candidatus Gottesmanbacteria bacterium]
MDNKINVGEPNTQKVGQNPDSQPMNIQNNPRVNYWMISSLVLGFLLFLMMGINLLKLRTASDTTPLPNPSISPTKSVGKVSFVGIIKTGAQLGEVKSYCSNGLYLIADEGSYLVNQTKMLLLRLPSQPDGTKMLSDQKYVGKKVEVVGKYPAQESFCEALICECEDYILVDQINIVDTQPVEKRQIKIEGQIDCLPHRDTSGGETLECAIGLQDKDGMYYGLQGLNQQDLISGKITAGKKVVITGIFTPSQDSKYNTIGTIEVVSVGYTNY